MFDNSVNHHCLLTDEFLNDDLFSDVIEIGRKRSVCAERDILKTVSDFGEEHYR